MKTTSKLPGVRGVSVRGVLPMVAAALAVMPMMPMRSLDATSLPDLAGVTDDKLVPTAIQTMRDQCKSLCACIDITVENLQDPLKGQFIGIKEQINKSLSTLADTDKVPAAHEANYVLRNLLSLFITSQQMMDHLQGMVTKQKTELQTSRNSLPTEVQAAIDARVAAGDLVTKADSQTAIDNAVKQARTDWEAGLSRIKVRQTSLNSAALPIPGDAILALKDEEFTAKETEAKARFDKLKPFNLPADRTKLLCWDADKAAFDMTVDSLASQTKKPGGGPDPFRTPPTPAAVSKVRVCV